MKLQREQKASKPRQLIRHWNFAIVPLCLALTAWFGITNSAFAQSQIPQAIRPDQNNPLGNESGSVFGIVNSGVIPGGTTPPINPSLAIGKSSLSIQNALSPICEKLSPSVVRIRGEYDRSSLGTVVTTDGLIIGKHSELTEKFVCILPDGREVPGRLIGIQPSSDLALIQIQATNLTPIKFKFDTPSPGTFAVSVGSGEQSVGFGLVTVNTQTFQIEQPTCKDCVDLGITVAPNPVSKRNASTKKTSTGLEVKRVYPRTVSEQTGILVGDLIRSINGTQLVSRAHLNEVAKSIKIGQPIVVEAIRDGKLKVLSSKVKSFAPRTVHDRWGGGPFSERRFGFSKVIAHDSVVAPEHCGGPIVSLQGDVIGINIARSMRVATFAIPIPNIYRFIKYVRPNAAIMFEN